MSRWCRLVVVVLTAAGTLSVTAAAVAQEGRTVTALASAAVKVQRPASLSSATIGRAVEAAREKSGPAAVRNAREEATRLAAAAGLTLGALQSVAEQSPSPFGPFGGYGLDGTFGPGRYCGRIRTAVFKRDARGRRVFQRRFRTRFGCRVPPTVTTTVSVTFAAA